MFSAIEVIQKTDDQHKVLRCHFHLLQSVRRKFTSELDQQLKRKNENFNRDILNAYMIMLEISVLPISVILELCDWIIEKYDSIKLAGYISIQ